MRKILLLCLIFTLSACDQLGGILESYPSTVPPTQSEISAGIREALVVGATNTVKIVSANNGFYGNEQIRIPFPPEAEKVAQVARDFGLGNKVDQFVETMNHGAERAAARATPIFVETIKAMTLRDVYDIWRGEEDAATQYLRANTMAQLKAEFRPEIKTALDQVELTRYWNPLINSYNQLPLGEKINPDLDEYVLERTLDGLFTVIAKEEALIRENPRARVTDLLEKVFGYLDQQN